MAKKAEKFPKEILVTQDREKDGTTWLVAYDGIENLDAEQNADEEVAVYVLKEIRRFVLTRDLVK